MLISLIEIATNEYSIQCTHRQERPHCSRPPHASAYRSSLHNALAEEVSQIILKNVIVGMFQRLLSPVGLESMKVNNYDY